MYIIEKKTYWMLAKDGTQNCAFYKRKPTFEFPFRFIQRTQTYYIKRTWSFPRNHPSLWACVVWSMCVLYACEKCVAGNSLSPGFCLQEYRYFRCPLNLWCRKREQQEGREGGTKEGSLVTSKHHDRMQQKYFGRSLILKSISLYRYFFSSAFLSIYIYIYPLPTAMPPSIDSPTAVFLAYRDK